jgi:GNAT superfamily N-acetyltransferase
MPPIEVIPTADGWNALADGQPIGQLRMITRPDGKAFLSTRDCRDDAYDPLITHALARLRRRVFVTVAEDDKVAVQRLSKAGFVQYRREYHYSIPVDPRLFRFRDTISADGIVLISAAEADLTRLRLLDDELRNLTPGMARWRWTEPAFRDETFSAGFDAATYLVAMELRTGSYVGLVRIWLKASGPRFGYVGVLPARRRTRVPYMLLATVFSELHGRGHAEVFTQIDSTNWASNVIARRAGARRIGASYELVRDAEQTP